MRRRVAGQGRRGRVRREVQALAHVAHQDLAVYGEREGHAQRAVPAQWRARVVDADHEVPEVRAVHDLVAETRAEPGQLVGGEGIGVVHFAGEVAVGLLRSVERIVDDAGEAHLRRVPIAHIALDADAAADLVLAQHEGAVAHDVAGLRPCGPVPAHHGRVLREGV